MTNIEVRLHIDPTADENVRKGILKGMKMYLDEEGLIPRFSLSDYVETAETERQFRNPRGQVDIEKWLNYLSTLKADIANGGSSDRPHWDFVVTSQDVCPTDTSQWNFVFGGFSGFYEYGRSDLASAVISTYRLRDRTPQLSIARGTLVGYHEVSHLKETEDCAEQMCIHYHYLGGLNDLDKLIPYLMRTSTIPKCDYHKG